MAGHAGSLFDGGGWKLCLCVAQRRAGVFLPPRRHETHAPARTRIDRQPPKKISYNAKIVMDPGVTVRGIVQDTEGRAVQGVAVRSYPAEKTATYYTDAEGRFAISGVPADALTRPRSKGPYPIKSPKSPSRAFRRRPCSSASRGRATGWRRRNPRCQRRLPAIGACSSFPTASSSSPEPPNWPTARRCAKSRSSSC